MPDIIWLMGNAVWYPAIRRRLVTMPRAERPPVLIWHGEPLPPPRSAGLPWPSLNLREIAKILLRDARATDVYTNYFMLRKLARQGVPDVLVVSGMLRRDFLAERGIPSHYVPFGSDDGMGRDLGLERDIDVLFLGSLDVPRRNRLLKQLERAGVAVKAAGSWSDPNYWGEARTRLLNRTKILLNFARTPAEFSGRRLLLGMQNKALVVSEPLYRPEPYVPDKHFVMAAMNDMPARIQYYLRNEPERRRIAEAGHQFAVGEMHVRAVVRKVLDHFLAWAAERNWRAKGRPA
jgi:hypothetical protein